MSIQFKLHPRAKLVYTLGLAAFFYYRSKKSRKRKPERPDGALRESDLAKNNGHYIMLSKGRTFYRMYNLHCSLAGMMRCSPSVMLNVYCSLAARMHCSLACMINVLIACMYDQCVLLACR